METQLSALERKIDDLLASVDEQGEDIDPAQSAAEDESADRDQDAKS